MAVNEERGDFMKIHFVGFARFIFALSLLGPLENATFADAPPCRLTGSVSWGSNALKKLGSDQMKGNERVEAMQQLLNRREGELCELMKKFQFVYIGERSICDEQAKGLKVSEKKVHDELLKTEKLVEGAPTGPNAPGAAEPEGNPPAAAAPGTAPEKIAPAPPKNPGGQAKAQPVETAQPGSSKGAPDTSNQLSCYCLTNDPSKDMIIAVENSPNGPFNYKCKKREKELGARRRIAAKYPSSYRKPARPNGTETPGSWIPDFWRRMSEH